MYVVNVHYFNTILKDQLILIFKFQVTRKGNLRVEEVDGSHETFILGENSKKVASIINKFIS